MARSRRRRRRQGVIIAIAAVLTVAVLVLARDVHREAFNSYGHQASLNRDFAALSATVLAEQDRLGVQTDFFLAHAPHLSRVDVASRISSLENLAEASAAQAKLLASPPLAHHVQTTLATVARLRATGLVGLLGGLARDLQLPGATTTLAPQSAQGDFARSNALWAAARRALRRAPGHVRLATSVFAPASAPLADEIAAAEASPRLKVRRAITITAIKVTPSPFPAPKGRWVLPPSDALTASIVVSNVQWVDQPVTLTVTLQGRKSRSSEVRRESATLMPDASRAFALPAFSVHPGEKATVNISLTGAPAATGGRNSAVYTVVVSPVPAA